VNTKNFINKPLHEPKKLSASELRYDPRSGAWVAIAESRAARPQWVSAPSPQNYTLAPPQNFHAIGAPCPFCRGNEGETPAGIEFFPTADSPWQVRVVPNLYPSVFWHAPTETVAATTIPTMACAVPAEGVHEVVIECPEHADDTTGPLPVEQLERVIRTYRHRLLSHRNDPRLKCAIVFKNAGYEAGASLPHPHSQIVGLPHVPPHLSHELDLARRIWQSQTHCTYCELVEESQTLPERTVCVTEHLVAVCPYAPRFAYETWLLPRTHRANFEDETDDVLDDLAQVLHRVLTALKTVHPNNNYNYYIHSAPFDTTCCPYYHWHLEVFPRTHRWAGFELGTGCIVNPTSPESAARTLRLVAG